MAIIKKFFSHLVFRSCCALVLGGLTVVSFTALLSLYGASQEPALQAAAPSLVFPENEQMLDTVTAQLAGAALSAIEPAAGE